MYQQQVEFAKNKFKNLKDGSGTLIFDHSIRVFIILEKKLENIRILLTKKKAILLAGLFHDLLEDTETTEFEIKKMGGKETLDLVKEMTINFSNQSIKKTVKPLYNTSDELTLVKLADIYDNVRRSPYFIRINGLDWYRNFFLPLLNEYKCLINYKINHQKKYKKLVADFSQDVIKEIEFLELNYSVFSKLI